MALTEEGIIRAPGLLNRYARLASGAKPTDSGAGGVRARHRGPTYEAFRRSLPKSSPLVDVLAPVRSGPDLEQLLG